MHPIAFWIYMALMAGLLVRMVLDIIKLRREIRDKQRISRRLNDK